MGHYNHLNKTEENKNISTIAINLSYTFIILYYRYLFKTNTVVKIRNYKPKYTNQTIV